jgi:deoxyribonuclease-1-like protein
VLTLVRFLLLFGGLFLQQGFSQDSLRILTWNIQNFGKSKDSDEIEFIASIARHFDILAIQEVSVSAYGSQAVAFLADELNRTGSAWDYRVSDPTTGNGQERYAWLWKKHKVKPYGKCMLASGLADSLDREPFLCRFIVSKDTLLMGSFHAVPTAKGPSREISFLYLLPKWYAGEKLIFMGDFNLSEKNPAFIPFKDMGMEPAIRRQKTSLRMEPKDGSVLANEYDNIFFSARQVRKVSAGAIDFTPKFPTLKEAREISDHIPVWLTIEVK